MDEDYDSEEERDMKNYRWLAMANKKEPKEVERDIQREYDSFHMNIGGYNRRRNDTPLDFNLEIFNRFPHESPIKHGYFPPFDNQRVINELEEYGLTIIDPKQPKVMFFRYTMDDNWEIVEIPDKTDGRNVFTHRLYIPAFTERYPDSRYMNIFITVTYVNRDRIVSDISYKDEKITRYSEISSEPGQRKYECEIRFLKKAKTLEEFLIRQPEPEYRNVNDVLVREPKNKKKTASRKKKVSKKPSVFKVPDEITKAALSDPKQRKLFEL